MHSPLPILRLANRPMVWLGWAWGTWMFSVLSVSAPGQTAMPAMDTWGDPAGPWFWRLSIGIPAASGLVASFIRMDLVKGSFAWLLPGLSGRMLTAMLLVGVAVAAPMAVTGFVGGHWSAGMAAMCLGLLSFALASTFNQLFTSQALAAAALLLMGAWYWAPQLSSVAVSQPLMLALLCGAGTYSVHRAWSGRDGLRSMAESLRVPEEPPLVGWLTGGPAAAGRSAPSLHGASAWAWARAVVHESPFGRAAPLLVAFGFMTGIDWVMMPDEAPSFGPMLFALACALWPLVPRRSQLYPISRQRRTEVNWLAAAMTAGTFWLAILAWTLIFTWLGAVLRGTERALDDLVAHLAFQLVWYPVLLWAPIRHEVSLTGSPQHLLRSPLGNFARIGGAMLLFAMLAEGTPFLIGRLDSIALQVTSALLLAAVVQLAFFAALRRYFLTGDLR